MAMLGKIVRRIIYIYIYIYIYREREREREREMKVCLLKNTKQLKQVLRIEAGRVYVKFVYLMNFHDTRKNCTLTEGRTATIFNPVVP